MSVKFHPLVQKTKIELERLDKKKSISWDERVKYSCNFLPISVEPKLRNRALKFINTLINLIEANNHTIKFEYNRCHIEMYEQLTEINLRQKYFRKRIRDASGYSTDTFEKSNKLEFQLGSYARKGWIDADNKKLEEYIKVIFNHIEKESKKWAELRKRQRIEQEKRKIQQKLEVERSELIAIDNAKLEKLINDAENYKKASSIRSYLYAFQEKINQSNGLINTINKDYIKWAFKKADDIDPLNNIY